MGKTGPTQHGMWSSCPPQTVVAELCINIAVMLFIIAVYIPAVINVLQVML